MTPHSQQPQLTPRPCQYHVAFNRWINRLPVLADDALLCCGVLPLVSTSYAPPCCVVPCCVVLCCVVLCRAVLCRPTQAASRLLMPTGERSGKLSCRHHRQMMQQSERGSYSCCYRCCCCCCCWRVSLWLIQLLLS